MVVAVAVEKAIESCVVRSLISGMARRTKFIYDSLCRICMNLPIEMTRRGRQISAHDIDFTPG
jgi:hypothetical protein